MVYFIKYSKPVLGPRRLARKEKIVPNEQLGVAALPSLTETMEGVLEWLKSERLHKYWPIFSRMNYPTLINLTESNLDHALICIGSDPITNGARGRIIRCTERLRQRSAQLNAIDETTPLDEIAEVFEIIASTPLSANDNEPDGVCLVRLFLQKLNQVVGFHGPDLVRNYKLKRALQSYARRTEIPAADKQHIERVLNNLLVAASPVASPKQRSPVQRLSTSSSKSSDSSSSNYPLWSQVCAFKTPKNPVLNQQTPGSSKSTTEASQQSSASSSPVEAKPDLKKPWNDANSPSFSYFTDWLSRDEWMPIHPITTSSPCVIWKQLVGIWPLTLTKVLNDMRPKEVKTDKKEDLQFHGSRPHDANLVWGGNVNQMAFDLNHLFH